MNEFIKNTINDPILLKVIESVVTIILFFIVKLIVTKLIDQAAIRFGYQTKRVAVFRKLARILLLIIVFLILLAIWGVEQKELILFLSSMITILGIAFFAQWSILSNITSSIIIFFNHPITIGSSLSIMDKDYPVDGEILDIGIFFITIQSNEGEEVTIPSSVLMQKMIKRKKSS